MRLYLKQRVFSWSDTFDIYNEYQEVIYQAKADILTLSHQIHVFDGIGEIGFIDQQVFTLLPRFDLTHRGNYVGELKKRFSPLSPYYTLDNSDWKISGDLFAHDYIATNDVGETIFTIEKAYLSWGDYYCLNVNKDEDAELALLVSIAIDAATCQD